MGLLEPVNPMINAETFSRLTDESVSGTLCYKVDGVIDSSARSEATAWISSDSNSLKRYELRCTVTDELRKLQEKTHKLLEAEGFPPETEEFLGVTINFYFDEVTFNNSISVDKVVSPTL